MNCEAVQDSELVSQFNAGDESAFIQIMERHQSRVFSAAMGLLHNPADAEEITQDTFLRAHRGFSRFRGDCSVATWLHRIAVNLARNRYWYFFRRRRQDTLSLNAPVGESGDMSFSDLLASESADPAEESSRGEFQAAVDRCLERLEPACRSILLMRTALDLPYEEIAASLGINVGTVKSRIARARERLRKRLEEECPDFARDSDPSDWFEPSRGRGHVGAC